MGLRDRLRRLQAQAREEEISIPQPTGPPARFPVSQLAEAFEVTMRRFRGEAVPPHPLSRAAANSPDPRWRETFFGEHSVPESEDLAE